MENDTTIDLAIWGGITIGLLVYAPLLSFFEALFGLNISMAIFSVILALVGAVVWAISAALIFLGKYEIHLVVKRRGD